MIAHSKLPDYLELLRVAGLCRVEGRLFELEQGAEAPAEDGAASRELASRTVYLRADRFLELSSTVDGSEIMSDCVAHGSAKDRKTVVKQIKGRALGVAMHP